MNTLGSHSLTQEHRRNDDNEQQSISWHKLAIDGQFTPTKLAMMICLASCQTTAKNVRLEQLIASTKVRYCGSCSAVNFCEHQIFDDTPPADIV